MKRNWQPARKEGTWKIRYYQVGYTCEKVKYRVPDQIAKNAELTRRHIARQERSPGQGMRQIQRTVNANFYRTSGWLLTLEYSDGQIARLKGKLPDGLSAEDTRAQMRQLVEHEAELWARRVRRARKQAGAEFKYFIVTSDLDGKTGEIVRWHHHVICDLDCLADAIAKWKHGEVDYEQLWDEPDHNDLVAYLLKQVQVKADEKRYTPSRNLIHPVPIREVTCRTDAELRVPAGCSLLERAAFSRFEPQYIRYTKPVGMIFEDEEVDERADE